jgi:hypothetical protein
MQKCAKNWENLHNNAFAEKTWKRMQKKFKTWEYMQKTKKVKKDVLNEKISKSGLKLNKSEK